MEKEHKNLVVYFILIILIFWTVVRKSALETDEALDEKVFLMLQYLYMTVLKQTSKISPLEPKIFDF